MVTCIDDDSNDIPAEIARFYVPKQLVAAWQALGGLPSHSQEAYVGMGFIDLADYTFLSKFLSPKENQVLLNGLYTVFQSVLNRQGGFLNKIEGDSMMFQFDGFLDPSLRNLPLHELKAVVAQKLFFTCVEIQRTCNMFNVGKEMFLLSKVDGSERQALADALSIIQSLRSSEMKQVLNAFFQIRARLGASFGEVTIGNFGPKGYKRWDIIGMPVIEARRMETTAPVGGLRISENLYKILSDLKIAEDYYRQFIRDAKLVESLYSDIRMEEVFAPKKVVVFDKQDAIYQTYSIQVHPDLPEVVTTQMQDLLHQGTMGLNRAVDLIGHFRGNRLVMSKLEEFFDEAGIKIRKHDLLSSISRAQYNRLSQGFLERGKDPETEVQKSVSLYRLFQILDGYLDLLGRNRISSDEPLSDAGYDEVFEAERRRILNLYRNSRLRTLKKKYLHEVIYPLVFTSIRASFMEYQRSLQPLVELS